MKVTLTTTHSTDRGSMDKDEKKGITGDVYEISVLPNTATELAEAIYNQKDLSKKDAMDMAGYLDKRYGMSGFVPTNLMDKDDSELDGELMRILKAKLVVADRCKVQNLIEAEKLKARKEEIKRLLKFAGQYTSTDNYLDLSGRLAELEGENK
jgi:hypothetical protein